MNQVEKYLWVEKYRPKSIKQMVLGEEEAKIFSNWIKNKEIPNLLLIGKPGSGKTTLARILVNTVLDSDEDMMVLNGSAQRGIAVIKEQVEEFLKTMIFGKNKIKIVFIDEADHLTGDAQAALRGIIEKYSDQGRFIFTANYEHKISDAIISRMQTFRFKMLPKNYIIDYAKYVLEKEEVEFDINVVKKIVSAHHPDVRKIIGILQSRVQDKKLSINLSDIESHENKLRSLINDIIIGLKENRSELILKSIAASQKLLAEFEIDFSSLYESINNTITPDKVWISKPLNFYFTNHYNAPIPNLNYIAFLYGIIECGLEAKEHDLL